MFNPNSPQRIKNSLQRMQKIGLDTSNQEAVDEFREIWYSPTKNPVGKLTDQERSDMNSMKDKVTSRIYAELPKGDYDPLTESMRRSKEDPEFQQYMNEVFRSKAAKDPKFTVWKRYFKQYYPAELEGITTASDQKKRIYDILQRGYLN